MILEARCPSCSVGVSGSPAMVAAWASEHLARPIRAQWLEAGCGAPHKVVTLQAEQHEVVARQVPAVVVAPAPADDALLRR